MRKEKKNTWGKKRCEVEFVFFFKQKTAYEIYQCDWSSDVCSSDLDCINCVAISSDCTLAVSGGWDKTIYVWDLLNKADRKSVV